ncbi:MAG: helix-turn-helix domain-containing protein, partial [Chloroflexi bacterium]|nr:helix-turn-helix domain-containing protein [Chloroflexota bacterium]
MVMTSTTMEWLTVNEAATYLKVARTTIYRWVKEKKLPLYQLGDRLVRLRREDLDAL